MIFLSIFLLIFYRGVRVCVCVKDILRNISLWENPAVFLLIPQSKNVCSFKSKRQDQVKS